MSTLELSSSLASKIPSRTEIGLQASRKGDFQTARQMFRKSINRLETLPDASTIYSQARIIQLLTYVGDSYVNEERYDLARRWYEKAWGRCGSKHEHSLLLACLIAKLAEIHILESDEKGFKLYFEKLQNLSSSLSLNGQVTETQVVNNLINEIKRLEKAG